MRKTCLIQKRQTSDNVRNRTRRKRKIQEILEVVLLKFFGGFRPWCGLYGNWVSFPIRLFGSPLCFLPPNPPFVKLHLSFGLLIQRLFLRQSPVPTSFFDWIYFVSYCGFFRHWIPFLLLAFFSLAAGSLFHLYKKAIPASCEKGKGGETAKDVIQRHSKQLDDHLTVYYSITICLHSKRFPRSACAVDSLLTSHPSTLSCLRRRESISYIHNPFSIFPGRWINKVNPEFPAPLAASFI